MKFSATFAILAAFVAQSVVCASYPPTAEDALDARAEFTDGGLEGLWDRFYDELLDEVEARDFLDDDDLFERSGAGHAAKKFVGDVASGVGPKAPKYTSEHSQRVAHNDRMSRPGFAQIAHNKIKHQSGRKRSFDDLDEYLFERSGASGAAKKFVGDVVSGVGQKTPKYATEHSQRKAHNDRMSRPGFAQTAHNKIKHSSGKKRALDEDDYLFERSGAGHAAKKFAGDVASGIGQKAPKYTSEYSQRVAFKDRMSRPGFAQIAHNKIKHQSGRKRSYDDLDGYLLERSGASGAAKKFVGDVVSGVGQKTPKYATEHSQRKAHNDRMSRPGFAQIAHQKIGTHKSGHRS